MMVRVLFTFGLAGLHVARVLPTFGLVALHLASVLFICWIEYGLVLVVLAYMWLGSCLRLAWLPNLAWALEILDMLVRVLFMLGLVGLHVARALSTFGLVALHLACVFFMCG